MQQIFYFNFISLKMETVLLYTLKDFLEGFIAYTTIFSFHLPTYFVSLSVCFA